MARELDVVTFDGGYGRTGRIWIELDDMVCDKCKESAALLMVDGSDAEYTPGGICRRCIEEAFDHFDIETATTDTTKEIPTVNIRSLFRRIGLRLGFVQPRVLVVCTGNTCRSPMAEGWIRLTYNAMVESVGTGAGLNRPASDGAIEVARRHGFDLTAHRSRSLVDVRGRQYDFVFAVSEGHADAARSYLPDGTNIIPLNIADPFGGNVMAYLKALNDLKSQIGPHLRRWKR